MFFHVHANSCYDMTSDDVLNSTVDWRIFYNLHTHVDDFYVRRHDVGVDLYLDWTSSRNYRRRAWTAWSLIIYDFWRYVSSDVSMENETIFRTVLVL